VAAPWDGSVHIVVEDSLDNGAPSGEPRRQELRWRGGFVRLERCVLAAR